MNLIRIAGIALISVVALKSTGASAPAQIIDLHEAEHASDLKAKITTLDGVSRVVKLAGVGCTQRICSRTEIKGDTETHVLSRTWLDSIAVITNTTPDSALLVMKDGSELRLSLVKDFRVLFFDPGFGGFKKLDLAKVKSVEFLARVP